MKWRNVLWVVLFSVPLLVVLALGFGHDPREVPSVLPGKVAPQCDLVGLDGRPMALTDLRGKPVVMNFWATWCIPCEAEHDLLQQAARFYGDRVHFIGVVYQDEADAARSYLARKGSTYPQVLDPASRCSIDYGVAGVPETFFIDAAGVVRHKQTGPVDTGSLQAALSPLLSGGRP